ncbi:MAG: squalene/phytoene synthase family protein [Hyphomonadaceae bacterium]
MSDTDKPATLATSEGFDQRLRNVDEARWLASRFAAPGARERLVAAYLLNVELRRALGASEAMLGKIRLQWWRETLEGVREGKVRRHDLSEELGRVFAGRAAGLAAAEALVDRVDDILDDHIHASGHADSEAHFNRHADAEAALVRLASLSLADDPSPAHVEALERRARAQTAMVAEREGAAAQAAAARAALKDVPSELIPAVAHYAGEGRPPLSMRWRIFRAILQKRA